MRKLLVALGLMTAVLLGASGSTSAGGWVVISLDATPIFRAGEPTQIGFTMLRHGVTLESEQPSGTPVQIVFTGPDGQRTTFDVEQSGSVGHHVATVTLPEAGTYTWQFVGEFMPVDEGRIDVPAGLGRHRRRRRGLADLADRAVVERSAGDRHGTARRLRARPLPASDRRGLMLRAAIYAAVAVLAATIVAGHRARAPVRGQHGGRGRRRAVPRQGLRHLPRGPRHRQR